MLKTKQVGEYTVSEVGGLERARYNLFQQQIEDMEPKILKIADEFERAAFRKMLEEWSWVASCVKPYISSEDWPTMPSAITTPLIMAATEVNDDAALAGGKKKGKAASPKSPKA